MSETEVAMTDVPDAPQTLAPSPEVRHVDSPRPEHAETVFHVDRMTFYYGTFRALRDTGIDIARHEVTALIGPSGCGKSTFLRCLNRMNDLIPGARAKGTLEYHGQDLHGPGIDPIEVRRRIGMVFQKP